MEQRESKELCDGCPMKFYPSIDSETMEVIKIFNDMMTPLGQKMPELILEAYKPGIDRWEFLRIFSLINFMQQTLESYYEKRNGRHSTDNSHRRSGPRSVTDKTTTN